MVVVGVDKRQNVGRELSGTEGSVLRSVAQP